MATKLDYKLTDQDGKVAAAGLSRLNANHVSSIRIRQGHAGNGHYIVYYWSFEWHTISGAEIVSGTASTWEEALNRACTRQHQCVYG